MSVYDEHAQCVKDGDTIVVRLDAGEAVDVRLWGIDAPERAALRPRRLANSAEDRLGTDLQVGDN